MSDQQRDVPDRTPHWPEQRARVAAMTWPPTLPFARVLERARTLDQAALGLLYKRFLPTVYRFAFARTSDHHIAEDITSATFLAMIEQITRTRAEEELGFAAWLLGIARNQTAMHFRSVRAAPPISMGATEDTIPAEGDDGDPLSVITARESWAEVVAALDLLTEEQRTVVLYRCVLGYSSEDVAALMDKRPGTVRALQFRALASLARHLDTDRPNPVGTSTHAPRREGRRGTRER